MTPEQLATVVARIQAGDNRTVDRVTLGHWSDIIGHLDHDDAMQAVRMHFTESPGVYLEAGHIIANCKRIAAERSQHPDPKLLGLDKDPAPTPDNLEAMEAAWNDPEEFRRQAAIYNRQLADAGYPIDARYPIAPQREHHDAA